MYIYICTFAVPLLLSLSLYIAFRPFLCDNSHDLMESVCILITDNAYLLLISTFQHPPLRVRLRGSVSESEVFRPSLICWHLHSVFNCTSAYRYCWLKLHSRLPGGRIVMVYLASATVFGMVLLQRRTTQAVCLRLWDKTITGITSDLIC